MLRCSLIVSCCVSWCVSCRASTCPTPWTIYKVVEEASYTNFGLNEEKCGLFRFTYRRHQCANTNSGVKMAFTTTRKIHPEEHVSDRYRYQCKLNGLPPCDQQCDKINLTLKMYSRISKNAHSQWSSWHVLGASSFLLKNCDKLYWTNWVETTKCSLVSPNKTYSRSCVDCDGYLIDNEKCVGNFVKQETCRAILSTRTKLRRCDTDGCGFISERKRKRKCLYENGNEADISLCSTETTVIKQLGNANVTNSQSSSEKNSKTFDIGIFVFVLMVGIFLIILFLRFFICRLLSVKSNKHQRSTHPTRPNIEHHTYNQIEYSELYVRMRSIIQGNSNGQQINESAFREPVDSARQGGHSNAELMALLNGYEIPMNLLNNTDGEEEESATLYLSTQQEDPCLYAQEDQNIRNSYENDNIADAPNQPEVQDADANAGYMDMMSLMPQN